MNGVIKLKISLFSTKSISVFLLVSISMLKPVWAHHGGEGITGVGLAGPIITVPAYTLPKGLKFINLLTDYTNFNSFSNKKLIELDKRHEHIHDTANLLTPSIGTGYGLTDNLTIGIRLPYVFRFGIKDVHDANVSKAGNAIGVGDITLFGQYRFLKNEKHNLNAALLTGLKIPSGIRRTKGRDGDLFETDEQPGSGSWDPFLGLAISKKLGQFSLDANGLYKFATRGSQGSDLGDVVNYNLAASYRLIKDGDFYENDVNAKMQKKISFDVILEANGIWSQKPKTFYGFVDENHGGTLVNLSPGCRLTYNRKWIWSLSTGLPIIDDLNGRQRRPNIRLLSVVTRVF